MEHTLLTPTHSSHKTHLSSRSHKFAGRLVRSAVEVMARVCVVGAGVVGLTTATQLQKALPPGSTVTIIADKFLKETTSDGAAGIFRPGLQFQGDSPEVTRRWLQDSFNFYKSILNSQDAASAGVKLISGFHFSSKYPKIVWNSLLLPILEEYRSCTEEELSFYRHKYGTFMTTILTECRRYLPYLTDKFTRQGGRIEKRHLKTLEELVRAPWIKNFYYVDYDMYIVPGFEYITLGGTRQFDSYIEETNKYDSMAIWERCLALIPSLKDAQVVQEWVGWRPYRPAVRVEEEFLTFDSGRSLKVVHNYGHGGYGVMTAPGTSIHAVKLVMKMLPSALSKL
ncbi:D-aspartate oxidase isoform X2 [Cherax quadricarinatus]|uniref:D-aspartate oxidase isoform X2 n=1 Tax=Cherax quadricarinatus TaxID=27406 RepID=UPI002377EC36|nr:D-amino-acid oxidase-like isoform X2 [Cherax quadricarinatus]